MNTFIKEGVLFEIRQNHIELKIPLSPNYIYLPSKYLLNIYLLPALFSALRTLLVKNYNNKIHILSAEPGGGVGRDRE